MESTAWLDALRTSRTWLDDDNEPVTTTMNVQGNKFVLAARCLNKNAYTSFEVKRQHHH